MTGKWECLACGGQRLKSVADLGTSPVLTGALFDDRESARRAVRGRLDLACCGDCGHVQNVAFDPELVEYDVSYDNSLHFSGTFQQYADHLVARLVDTYDVRGRHVVEIGSGKGDFLGAIARAGGNAGTGYDPTVAPDTTIPGVRLVQDYFRPGDQAEHYDLLVCRHVLEHLDDPATLLRSLATSAPDGAMHYVEVPSAEFNFGPDGLWDCIYPHVSYFSTGSLQALLRRCGFEIESLGRSFHGQFISADVRAGDPADMLGDATEHVRVVGEFARCHRQSVARWKSEVAASGRRGQTVAVWGAGSKGVNFLNAVDPDGMLPAVDINPRKWGRFLPGGGHQVIAPEDLGELDVSTVAVTNPVYRDEIAGTLADLGVCARVVTV
ncbi:MAG: class I SAM-dependent methyltransferase [Actinopolymorphaceae bacterium]